VIDRLEGEWAVLLLGAAGTVVNIPRSHLPPGAREGAWVQVTYADEERGEILAITRDDATAQVHQRIAEKLERLRRGEHLT
jgi:hypothetical protein